MRKRYPVMLALAAAVAVIGLAACGGDDDNSSDSGTSAGTSAAGGAAGGDTVSTQSISGTGTVLVDSSGRALYTNDMDKGTKIACTEECAAEWLPLVVQGQPSSSDGAVQSKLGTVKRPDGTTQVTYGGLPLYTFVEDTAGQVTGNGEADSFGGTDFTWTVASTSGSAGGGSAAAPTTTSDSSSSGGGYSGGY